MAEAMKKVHPKRLKLGATLYNLKGEKLEVVVFTEAPAGFFTWTVQSEKGELEEVTYDSHDYGPLSDPLPPLYRQNPVKRMKKWKP